MKRQRAQRRSRDARRSVALEAARLMQEQGIRDFRQAKLKAAERLGVSAVELPNNAEIEAALMERRRLFAPQHADHLRRLRESALQAMQHFSAFEPRLVGPVLEGTADEHSAVCLHVHLDNPDEFMLALEALGFSYRHETREVRGAPGRSASAYTFEADGVSFDVTALSRRELRQPPTSPTTGRALNRASAHGLRELLKAEDLPSLISS